MVGTGTLVGIAGVAWTAIGETVGTAVSGELAERAWPGGLVGVAVTCGGAGRPTVATTGPELVPDLAPEQLTSINVTKMVTDAPRQMDQKPGFTENILAA